MAEKPRIVVIGAGVIGLTNALVLARKQKYDITIVAKYMPGDLDPEYSSPWAGANYMPFSPEGSREANWERDTWPELERLARDHPESGIHFQDTIIYGRNKDANSAGRKLIGHMLAPEGPWFKSYVPNFRILQGDDLKGSDVAVAYGSVCINVNLYLPWLVAQCLALGVKLKRGVLSHVKDAADAHHSGAKADLVISCPGLWAVNLGGVEDKAMVPIRGQTVLVRNDPGAMYGNTGTDDGDEEMMYIMQRAAGGGTILGGSYQKGNWDKQIDPNLANRIMKRAVEAAPQLTGGKGVEHLDIIRHSVGFRPSREGGPRVESETIDDLKIVHCYGHGGYGYQSSYGCVASVIELVEGQL